MGGFKLVFLLFGLVLSILFSFFPLLLVIGIFFVITGRIGKNNILRGIASHRSPAHREFLERLIHILVHMSQADGHVDERELSVIRRYFRQSMQFPESEMPWVDDLINTAIHSSIPIEKCCAPFKNLLPDTFRLIVTELMYEVANADSKIQASEKAFIERVVGLMGVSPFAHESIRSKYQPKQSDQEKYASILGCSPNASKSEIKKAYREASKKYHPDKVASLGDEFKKVAEKRMQDINLAYSELKKIAH